MWDVVLDALLDTLKLFPFLFVLYLLIEVMEHNTGVGKPRKALSGHWAPALGAALGVVPMCGFSVMAAKLYRHRHITLGTLLAVFITTSDEAVIVLIDEAVAMFVSGEGGGSLLISLAVLLGCKLAIGIAVGYLFDAIFRRVHGAPAPLPAIGHEAHVHGDGHDHEHEHKVEYDRGEGTHVRDEGEETHETHDDAHDHEHGECACDELSPCEHKHGGKVRMYLVSPLLHALQVAGFVLLVNLLFGFLFYLLGGGDDKAGAEAVGAFMRGTGYWLQPLVCSLVGAIPNCASSVILSEVYALGGIGFGGLLAGLVVNASLGYLVLFEKGNWKRGLLILGGMFLFSVAVGFAANAICLLL